MPVGATIIPACRFDLLPDTDSEQLYDSGGHDPHCNEYNRPFYDLLLPHLAFSQGLPKRMVTLLPSIFGPFRGSEQNDQRRSVIPVAERDGRT